MIKSGLPIKNLLRRPGRSVALVLLTAFLALSVFGGSVVVSSLRSGLDSLQARFGADIIVLPSSARSKVDFQELLLQGTAGAFYMSADALDKVREVEGVELTAPQTFLASLKADCCAVKVQVIGIDAEADFTVQPWIAQSTSRELGDMDVAVGCKVSANVGKSLKLYDQHCHVVAKLAETGTGLDTAVYCDMDTMRTLLVAAEAKGVSNKLTSDDSDVISAIYVKVADGCDIDVVMARINAHVRKASAVRARSLFTGAADSLAGVSRTVAILAGAAWALALVILLIAFVMMTRERRREFAVLRLLGASRKGLSRLTCMLLVLVMMIGAMALAESDVPIEIATAEQLAAINDNLAGHYVLTADIDLAGIEWTPIGAYAPSGESEEEQEIPAADTAFTGTFDGQGHTISGLTIDQPESWAMGLFGCAANAEIANFTLENASVDAALMSADVVGYAYCTTVSGVTLVNGSVNAHFGEMSAEGMYGGIVGAGLGSMIENCTAQAEITLPDGTANAGIVGGGLEMTSVVNCTATGTITAGNNCYGLGGVSGCGFAAEQFTNDTAENVTITAGDNCTWIGGITGYAGGYPDESLGMPVTVFTNCIVRNVTVTTGENADGIGDIVGSGFYSEEAAAANGAPFDQPTQYELVDCAVENEAEDDAIATAQLMEDVKGTYVALFPVITAPEFDQLWLDPCAAVVGEEAASDVAEMLKAACSGTIYGQEAIDAFGDGSNGAQFDCLFINGVDQITFDGTTISGSLEGEEVFSHEYAYVGPLSLAGMMDGYLYETADADAGEYRYFFMMPDTPATTYHLEFRYGSDVEALTQYNEGPYAYWLAAGFPVDADEAMIEDVITLFCEENLAEMQADDAA